MDFWINLITCTNYNEQIIIMATLARHYQAALEGAVIHSRSRQMEERASPQDILAIILEPLVLPSLNTVGVSLDAAVFVWSPPKKKPH
jgi:hypothetical protein